jgi:hypothetical protein
MSLLRQGHGTSTEWFGLLNLWWMASSITSAPPLPYTLDFCPHPPNYQSSAGPKRVLARHVYVAGNSAKDEL